MRAARRPPPAPLPAALPPAGPTFCAGRTSQCSVSFSSWKPACSSRLRHSATTAGGESRQGSAPRGADGGRGGGGGSSPW